MNDRELSILFDKLNEIRYSLTDITHLLKLISERLNSLK